jgi:hypothetical protein
MNGSAIGRPKVGILAKNDSDTHDGDSGDSVENCFGGDYAMNQSPVGEVRKRVA